jgi:hypothetical protein
MLSTRRALCFRWGVSKSAVAEPLYALNKADLALVSPLGIPLAKQKQKLGMPSQHSALGVSLKYFSS